MSDRWFLVDAIAEAGARIELPPEETRHAAGARRLRDGDPVCVFDGAGTVATAILLERGRCVEIESIERHPAPPPVEIAAAVPKGDRMATLLDMATQLGMTAFIPLRTRHGVVESGPKAVPRWHRICIEACKQSRRAWLPKIDAQPLEPVAAVADAVARGAIPLLAAQDGASPSEFLSRDATAVRFLIGPEGGFDAAEVESMLDAGARSIRLGAHVLRVETAAVAAVAATAALG